MMHWSCYWYFTSDILHRMVHFRLSIRNANMSPFVVNNRLCMDYRLSCYDFVFCLLR